jgi:hypothetical protein
MCSRAISIHMHPHIPLLLVKLPHKLKGSPRSKPPATVKLATAALVKPATAALVNKATAALVNKATAALANKATAALVKPATVCKDNKATGL